MKTPTLGRTPFYAFAFGAIALSAAGMNPASRSALNAASVTAPVTAVSTSANVKTAAPAAVAAPSPAAMRHMQVDSAIDVLESSVVQQSHEGALREAFQAYYNFKAAHPEDVKKPYLYFVDYGLDNRTPRGYVFDMDQLTVVDGPFIVASGRGSSSAKDGVPTKFANTDGSAATSLGLYVTQEEYSFTGHTGGQPYSSVGLRLNGVSGKYNDMARERRVVVHGAPYVTPSGSGRSEGCPAMEQARAHKLIPMLAEGSLVFLYSPNDADWVSNDPWATAAF
jgi:hypothetical protein